MLVHNLLLLGAIVASAVGAAALAERLTGNRTAGVAAGIVFAFVPYRFDHYMHMELQWTIWMPWAFWGVHRTIESGRWRHGLLTGVFVSLQMLSSVYYGIFLATIVPLFAALLLLRPAPRSQVLGAVRALAGGGVVMAVVCGAYALPYLAAGEQVGRRSPGDIAMFSARPYDYLTATPNNRVYGDVFAGRPERRQFPGVLPLLLAVAGLLLRAPERHTVAYLIALVIAFEMSLGLHGFSYRFLYEHVPLYAGLRAPARLGIFAIMFLSVLAAIGYTAVRDVVPAAARRVLAVLIPSVLLVEYSVKPLDLVPYPNTPPPLYEFVARLPPGVVAEFPLPEALPGPEPRYMYMSTFHWKPLINGYSGFYPPSYLNQLRRLQPFPDAFTVGALQRTGVSYVIVHLPGEESTSSPKPSRNRLSTYESATQLLLDLQKYPQMVFLGRLKDETGVAVVYRLE
jgi:hypothetical protein